MNFGQKFEFWPNIRIFAKNLKKKSQRKKAIIITAVYVGKVIFSSITAWKLAGIVFGPTKKINMHS